MREGEHILNRLLELLGQEAFDKLKAAMGDDFESFAQQYEDEEISDEQVVEKQKELGLLEKEEDVPEGGEEDPEEDKKDPEDGEEDPEDKEIKVLSDGWLLEDGEVDYEKIGDESLRNYIKGLNDRLKESEWDYQYKMAIMIEAMRSDMYDTSDADRYISPSDLSMDEEGNVVGVKEAFSNLRKNKPHLFKPAKVGGDNPLDEGFNPVDKKVSGKPRSYAEAVEQTRSLVNN